jgi:hypothetical protein
MGLARKKYLKPAFDVAETVNIDYRFNKKSARKVSVASL